LLFSLADFIRSNVSLKFAVAILLILSIIHKIRAAQVVHNVVLKPQRDDPPANVFSGVVLFDQVTTMPLIITSAGWVDFPYVYLGNFGFFGIQFLLSSFRLISALSPGVNLYQSCTCCAVRLHPRHIGSPRDVAEQMPTQGLSDGLRFPLIFTAQS
jgi:hypothetical protein